MGKAIILGKTLIYLSEDRGRLETIDCFLRLMHPNCLASSHIISSLGLNQRLIPFSKKLNEVGFFWSSVNIKFDELKIFKIKRLIMKFFRFR